MLTTQDKKYISSEITSQIGNGLKKNNEILIKGMSELFDVTNERIDKVLAQLKDHHNILNNHERRIEKVEEKVFTTTIA